jgi:hypothetical protein
VETAVMATGTTVALAPFAFAVACTPVGLAALVCLGGASLYAAAQASEGATGGAAGTHHPRVARAAAAVKDWAGRLGARVKQWEQNHQVRKGLMKRSSLKCSILQVLICTTTNAATPRGQARQHNPLPSAPQVRQRAKAAAVDAAAAAQLTAQQVVKRARAAELAAAAQVRAATPQVAAAVAGGAKGVAVGGAAFVGAVVVGSALAAQQAAHAAAAFERDHDVRGKVAHGAVDAGIQALAFVVDRPDEVNGRSLNSGGTVAQDALPHPSNFFSVFLLRSFFFPL